MKKRNVMTVLLSMFHLSVGVNNSAQEEGRELTVQIYEELPRHLCGRALASLEVSTSQTMDYHTWFYNRGRPVKNSFILVILLTYY